MELNIIVAMSINRVIGKDNKVPWKIKDDMLLFKGLTTNKTVIMGKNTWLSLPVSLRPLQDRNNIIVSKTLPEQNGAFLCRSIEDALELSKRFNVDVFCIGGAKLYIQMLPITQVLHISLVKSIYEGDTYFPEINYDEWILKNKTDFEEFTYNRYERKIKIDPFKSNI
ncbi:MAG: dihydrofolate reductase [Candidatus Micrarchaeaceae archaeon]